MKFIVCLMAFLLPFCGLSGQDSLENDLEIEKMAFARHHLSFTYSPRLVNKAKISNKTGPYELNSSLQPGLGGGINYHINFSQHYSIILGFHGNLALRNYIVFVPKEAFQPQAEYDFDEDGGYTRSGDFYLSFPVHAEKRWFTGKGKIWNLSTGISLNNYPAGNSSEGSAHLIRDGNGNWHEVLYINREIGTKKNNWIDYQLTGGRTWILENMNIIKLNLLANVSTTKMVNGSYKITVPGKPDSFGDYSATYSYIGLSAQYVFTGARKAIQQSKVRMEKY